MPNIDKTIELSKRTNRSLEEIRDVFTEMKGSDTQILDYYYGENGKNILGLFNELVDGYKNGIIKDNLNRIDNYLSQTDNPNEIEKLNEGKKLDEESLHIIDEIPQLIEAIKGPRLNEALRDESLRSRALRLVDQNNMKARVPEEEEVIRHVRNETRRKGGRRKRKNKTNNKKYIKKYVSKKNKKNY